MARRLTIVCNLEIYYSDRQTEGKRQKIEFKMEETPALGDNLAKCLGNPEFADVTLVCGAKSFPCHKAILSARSDVFAAMFSHKETTESIKNEVVLADTEPELLQVGRSHAHMRKGSVTSKFGPRALQNALFVAFYATFQQKFGSILRSRGRAREIKQGNSPSPTYARNLLP